MIINHRENDGYLDLARANKIPLGLGLGIELDTNLRWKRGNFNIILGHANVGKTYWYLWYLAALSSVHGQKHLINSSENTINTLKRNIIELYTQKGITKLTPNELELAKKWLEKHFDFVNTNKLRTLKQFMTEVQPLGDKYDNLMIDPHNSFLKPAGVNSHDYDYESATRLRKYAKDYGTTIGLCAHGVTEALRKVHPKGHDFEGFTTPCNAADAEGGGKWVNRADDFLVIHRYTQSPSDWMYTDVHVRKVKETESGGRPTFMDSPVRFQLMQGTKFLCNGKNAIKQP